MNGILKKCLEKRAMDRTPNKCLEKRAMDGTPKKCLM